MEAANPVGKCRVTGDKQTHEADRQLSRLVHGRLMHGLISHHPTSGRWPAALGCRPGPARPKRAPPHARAVNPWRSQKLSSKNAIKDKPDNFSSPLDS